MKSLLLRLFLIPGMLIFTGCPYGYRYDDGKLPGSPVNLAAVNSAFDDINLPAPFIQYHEPLYFSSNRNSDGENYDIIWDYLFVEWNKEDGTLVVDNREDYDHDPSSLDSLLKMVNTEGNEFGPYALTVNNYQQNAYKSQDVLIYASDSGGHAILKFVYHEVASYSGHPDSISLNGPYTIKFLNDGSDNLYLSFRGEGFIHSNYDIFAPNLIKEICFCSNRAGNFDIYQTNLPGGYDIIDALRVDTVLQISPVSALNSAGDDKCPFINGNLLVFASNRPGGYGGYDLYYSVRSNDTWSTPKNFGDKINSAYNEYRPVTVLMWEFDQDLMMFSSDRPGGSGGYDLYYVGIPKMIE